MIESKFKQKLREWFFEKGLNEKYPDFEVFYFAIRSKQKREGVSIGFNMPSSVRDLIKKELKSQGHELD